MIVTDGERAILLLHQRVRSRRTVACVRCPVEWNLLSLFNLRHLALSWSIVLPPRCPSVMTMPHLLSAYRSIDRRIARSPGRSVGRAMIEAYVLHGVHAWRAALS